MKAKIKIMKTRPVLSEDEVRSFMDFDALLADNDARLQERRIFRNVRNVCMGIACVLTIPALIFFIRFQQSEGTPEKKHVSAPESATPQEMTVDSSLQNTADPLLKKDPTYVSPTEKETDAKNNLTRPDKPAPKAAAPPTNKDPVYVQAEPAEGYPSLYRYFDDHLVYPSEAVKDSVEGTVNVVFIIDRNGNATEIKVENSLGPLFDDEATRLVANMPAWKPATYDGEPVRSKISLPITFGLHKTRNH